MSGGISRMEWVVPGPLHAGVEVALLIFVQGAGACRHQHHATEEREYAPIRPALGQYVD